MMSNEVTEEEECVLCVCIGVFGLLELEEALVFFCSNSFFWRKKLWEVSVGRLGGDRPKPQCTRW